MKRSNQAGGVLCVVATALLWSTGGLFIKLIPWSPLSINSARCIVALAVNLLIFRQKPSFPISRSTLLAGICFGLTATLLTVATKLTTAANAILLQYTSPLFIILFEAIRLRRRPRGIDLLCSGGILAGMFLCCAGGAGTGRSLGNFIALLSGCCFAAMFVFSARSSTQPSCVNLIGFVIGFVVGLPQLVRETSFSVEIILFVLILGAGQFGLAYALFARGIQRVPPLAANFITTLEPILNPIWVAVFYGESIRAFTLLGGAVTIVSAVAYSVIPILIRKQKVTLQSKGYI